MKEGMDRYASKTGNDSKGYFRKHTDRNSGREAYKASRSDRLQRSRQEQEKEEVEGWVYNGPPIESSNETYGKIVVVTENVVPNQPLEEYEQLSLDMLGRLLAQAAADQIIKELADESIREEDVVKTHQEGRQGIQGSDQGRCETEETNPSQTKVEKVKKQSTKQKKQKLPTAGRKIKK